jgi:hypothetical protein
MAFAHQLRQGDPTVGHLSRLQYLSQDTNNSRTAFVPNGEGARWAIALGTCGSAATIANFVTSNSLFLLSAEQVGVAF